MNGQAEAKQTSTARVIRHREGLTTRIKAIAAAVEAIQADVAVLVQHVERYPEPQQDHRRDR